LSFGSEETGMTGSIHPWISEYLRDSPASGPLRGTAGQGKILSWVTEPPPGRPVGGGGVHRNLGHRGLNPI